jgi:acyl-CoA thioesterase-2
MSVGLPQPEDLAANDWGEILERRSISTPAEAGSRSACWLRVKGPLAEDLATQSCALAYTSDDIPTEATAISHPRSRPFSEDPSSHSETFVGASLDHSIWFHRPGRQDDWVLHEFQSYGLVGARGLSVGQIYSRDGLHLATVAQEILLRERTR